MGSIQIIWFKRDLRTSDHAPLHAAAKIGQPILPLYIVEKEFWRQPTASRRHWSFIYDCLIDLNTELTGLGQPLVIRIGKAIDVFKSLHESHLIERIHASEETGNNWTYCRDIAVRRFCADNEITLNEYPSNGIVRKLKNRNDWSNIRNSRMKQKIIMRPKSIAPVANYYSDLLPDKNASIFGVKLDGKVQVGGRKAAVSELRSFLDYRSERYLQNLSAPGLSEIYCSRLSAHLAWGTLSVREVVQAVNKRQTLLSIQDKKKFNRNLNAFKSRLAWRCHFIQKLEDQPEIESLCMHPAFEGLRKQDEYESYFKAWATGYTGYPFIDACMRNLLSEGWITFRMRAMLVSFASYQLWIDWRITGNFLAKVFTDYEPGIHYSQLQMQSGVTGINAMRVYNPVKQSIEHDPSGAYIRKWVPELVGIPDEFIHTPWKQKNDLLDNYNFVLGRDYPEPIVNQETSTKLAKQKIIDVRNSENFKQTASAVFQKLGSRKRPSKKAPKSKKQHPDQLSLF